MSHTGRILSGRYELIRQLGQGGMGSVWEAHHLGLRSRVAVKLIDPAIAENPDYLRRFLREAQAAAALRSPHVVQVFDYGIEHGIPYIAMELLEGESLGSRLERVRRLSPEDTARITVHVARAVNRAHEAGIVHRDLKPDNIFLVRNDDEELAKVLDFGIAKSALATGGGGGTSGAGVTRSGMILGTPYYMSPEQIEGKATVDYRTDIWSIGVIAFECLTGVRPFAADTFGGIVLAICARPVAVPSAVAPVPGGFDAWFARSTAREAPYRFASAKEQAQSLKDLCQNPPIFSRPQASHAAASSGASARGFSPGNAGGAEGGVAAFGADSAAPKASEGPLARATTGAGSSLRSRTPAASRAPWIAIGVALLGGVVALSAMVGLVVWQIGLSKLSTPGPSVPAESAVAVSPVSAERGPQLSSVRPLATELARTSALSPSAVVSASAGPVSTSSVGAPSLSAGAAASPASLSAAPTPFPLASPTVLVARPQSAPARPPVVGTAPAPISTPNPIAAVSAPKPTPPVRPNAPQSVFDAPAADHGF